MVRFQRFERSVLTTTKHVGVFAELWRVCFDLHKVFRRLAEVRRLRFDHRKHVARLQSFRVCFDHRKTCRRPVEVLGVRFHSCKACRRLLERWRIRFDYAKA